MRRRLGRSSAETLLMLRRRANYLTYRRADRNGAVQSFQINRVSGNKQQFGQKSRLRSSTRTIMPRTAKRSYGTRSGPVTNVGSVRAPLRISIKYTASARQA